MMIGIPTAAGISQKAIDGSSFQHRHRRCDFELLHRGRCRDQRNEDERERRTHQRFTNRIHVTSDEAAIIAGT